MHQTQRYIQVSKMMPSIVVANKSIISGKKPLEFLLTINYPDATAPPFWIQFPRSPTSSNADAENKCRSAAVIAHHTSMVE